ncbi:MAG TPA: helicase-exonuclease AddAB subunit AddA, partial [Clostridia bacterium]|nr:helicase-exonuclease AddAB subunit AddA [Clostridia bacterium]
MAERVWTKDQNDAITAPGTLLVSAAAGSGKTAVLVERVIQKITDSENPCDADRLLVVTFTNAAASEMRERLSQRLEQMIAENPEDLNLQRQQILLQNSHISTVHAFCLDLIRENFEKLDLSPDFRIADDSEMKVLLQDTLDQLLEENYADAVRDSSVDNIDEKPFIILSEMLGTGRDDTQLADAVIRLHRFVRSLPDPQGWLSEKLEMYRPGRKITETEWGKPALDYLSSAIGNDIALTEQALSEIHRDERLIKAYGPAFESDLSGLRSILRLTESGDWDGVCRAAGEFGFQKLGPLRKFEDERLKSRVTGLRDAVKKSLVSLKKGILCCDEQEFQSDINQLYPVVRCLFEIVGHLDQRLFEEKIGRNILDFSDLEQLTLRLLVEKKAGGFVPTSIAERVSRRFEEVMIDEYQDTNLAQDTIFRSVSRGETNLFMVGDVKQSIYRFRQAMPEIFIEKKERFAPYGEGVSPARIILGKNFRSRSGVTDAVNFIFHLLMTKQMGEISYGREEELIPGADYPVRQEPDFEIRVVDASGYEGEDDRDTLEAQAVASMIRKMVDSGFTVSARGGTRPAEYRDFCVLMRSTSGRAEKYLNALAGAGIPAYSDLSNGYLGSYEVSVILSLMRILDNPLQDVPLLSVMFSPAFGFEPDDLAKIKLENRKKSLYLALTRYASVHGGKYQDFLSMIGKLRSLAAVLPTDRLLLRIYSMTGFPNICGAMTNGEKRRANLRLLLDYARNYEAAGYRGLSGFIRFIDRLGEQNGDLAPASTVTESANVVRVMSIHKSKGLEFPVCVLAGCARQFNREDLNKAALFHPVYGFGSMVRDAKLNCRYTTLPREIVRLETGRSALSEELRTLYVALTRAKEKLIAVLTPANPEGTLKKAAALIAPNGKDGALISPYTAGRAQSYAEWLLACALLHPSGSSLRERAGISSYPTAPAGRDW